VFASSNFNHEVIRNWIKPNIIKELNVTNPFDFIYFVSTNGVFLISLYLLLFTCTLRPFNAVFVCVL